MSCKLSKGLFNDVILRALEELPPDFAQATETLRIEVRDRPSRRMLSDAGVESGHTLLGLYQGRPATRRSVEDSAVLPDVIYLFQRELEEISGSEEQLQDEIRRTLLHEIGHHFGLDEDDLERLGYS